MSRPRGDLVLTNELDTLQRKYRSMELARRDLNDDNGNTLRMQRCQIDKLKKDHERIKEELALETRQAKLSNNMSATHSIAKLQDQGDIYQRKIEYEKRTIAELSESMAKMSQAIFEQRKQAGGVNAARDFQLSCHKQIRILENRLDKALVKFNEALAHNKQLRETIDNLRRERVVFDGIYRKLERELGEKKSKMAAIIDVSHAAYEARGAAQSEMFALKANADEQKDRFEQEWDSLGTLIQKDAEMKMMLVQKQQVRSYALTHGLSTTQDNALTSVSSVPCSATMPEASNSSLTSLDPLAEEEMRLRLKLKKARALIRKDRLSIAASQAKVASYEESFAKIQTATSINDIEQLVGVFVAAEDENFKLFNFVNSLNHEIERIEDQIDNLNTSMAAYNQHEHTQSSDSQRKAILSTLAAQYKSAEAQTAAFDAQTELMKSTLTSLTNSIVDSARALNCVAPSASGEDGTVSLSLPELLSAIESKANELIEMYNKNQRSAAIVTARQQEAAALAISRDALNGSDNELLSEGDDEDTNTQDDEDAADDARAQEQEAQIAAAAAENEAASGEDQAEEEQKEQVTL